MEKRIRLFKNFEEQQAHHMEQMRNTTVRERFRQLYAMQQMTQMLHPVEDTTCKITIGKWKPLG